MGKLNSNLWGIVLAGGEGERLKGFIRERLGSDAPKQFCTFLGHRTMVEATLKRASLTIPHENLVLVGTEHQRQHLFRSLGNETPGTILLQPRGCDTAPGILLPLLHILHRDPWATVVILPSDQFVRPGRKLMAAVSDAAAHLTHASSDSLVLLGAEATYPEPDYGWIQPGSEISATGSRKIHCIDGFVEKPTEARADRLMRGGGLWNTMVMVARAASLWHLVLDFAPDLAARFSRLESAIGTDREQDVMNRVYQTLPHANFSSMVLAHCPERLLVVPIRNVLWSDWGRGERILETLERIKGPSLLAPPLREAEQEAGHAAVALTI